MRLKSVFKFDVHKVSILALTIIVFIGVGAAQDVPLFTENGSVESFSTSGNYQLDTLRGENVTTTSMDLVGEVSNISDLDDPINVWFNISEESSSSWSRVDAGTVDESEMFSTGVSNLSPGTLYEFEAYTDHYSGTLESKRTVDFRTESGGSASFTTGDYSVNTTGTNALGYRSLNLTAETQNLSELYDPIDVWFNINAVNGDYSEQLEAGTVDSTETFNRVVTGLNQSTEYEFEACTAHYCGGFDSVTTSSYDVSTEGALGGTDSLRFEGLLSNTETFTTEINDQILVQFQYRQENDSTWNTVDADQRSIDGKFIERVNGLPKNTMYEFRAVSEDGNTGEILTRSTTGLFTAEGGVVTFSTGPIFNVSIDSINTPVFGGDDVEVEALIQNNGASGAGTIDLNISGIGSDSVNVDLGSDDAVIKTLNVSTSSSDAGEYTANISSGSDNDVQAFNVSELRPPAEPQPESGTDSVGMSQNLSAVVNGTGSFDRGINLYVKKNSNNLSIGSSLALPSERVNASLSSIVLDTNTTYDWFAESEYSGMTEVSPDWNFTTVEKPQVESLSPVKGASNVDENPTLEVNVTGPGDVNVSFYDYASDNLMKSEIVSSGSNTTLDTSTVDDFGSNPQNYWYVVLESRGAEWNNSNDEEVYYFTTTDISEVNYELANFESGNNLNPGSISGLNEVIGQEEIEFRVSNPEGSNMDIGFNITDGSQTGQFGRINDISNDSVASVSIPDAITNTFAQENMDDLEIQAYFISGTEEFYSDGFVSGRWNFSTHVAELDWNGTEYSENYVIYYNNDSQGQAFSEFRPVGSTGFNGSVGVANSDLSSGNVECYRVTGRNIYDEESLPTNEKCVTGVVP